MFRLAYIFHMKLTNQKYVLIGFLFHERTHSLSNVLPRSMVSSIQGYDMFDIVVCHDSDTDMT